MKKGSKIRIKKENSVGKEKRDFNLLYLICFNRIPVKSGLVFATFFKTGRFLGKRRYI
jgi:hypothetical protein